MLVGLFFVQKTLNESALDDVFVDDFADVLDDFFILAAMTAALIGVALKKFNDKLE